MRSWGRGGEVRTHFLLQGQVRGSGGEMSIKLLVASRTEGLDVCGNLWFLRDLYTGGTYSVEADMQVGV